MRPRCSLSARSRGDALVATAPPARRVLVVEVQGPWGSDGITSARLPRAVARAVRDRAAASGARVQLVRRPGRPAVRAPGRAWALVSPDDGVIRWGRCREDAELLDVDPAAPLDLAADSVTGPQRLALVCAHAQHDVCCALLGRPVAAALQQDGTRDTWETSHLGGDRFAPNLLLLPEGEMFGQLDPGSAVRVTRRLDAGRLTLEHYRGRMGQPPVAQAAVHLAAQELADDRREAMRVTRTVSVAADRWEVHLERRHLAMPTPVAGQGAPDVAERYQLVVGASWQEPDLLTCGAVVPRAIRTFHLLSIQPDP